MEPITLTFLGTGNAVPTKQRNHTAILLNYKNENILFDCGEGTQRQFRIAHLSPNKITRICLTHWHGDHILGLPGLFQTLGMQDYKEILQIYGPKGTNRYLQLIKELVTTTIHIESKEVNGKFFDTSEFYLEATPMQHGTPTLAYSFTIKNKVRLDPKKLKKFKLPNSPLLKQLAEGKDITFNDKKIKASDVSYEEKGRKITIIMDTALNENALEIAKDSDLLICEATFSKDEQALASEYKHLTATEAATIAKKAKVKQLVLTHLSQRHEHHPKEIESEAKTVFKNTSLVKDFDVIRI